MPDWVQADPPSIPSIGLTVEWEAVTDTIDGGVLAIEDSGNQTIAVGFFTAE